MKLIIDITENEYRHIKEYYEKNDIVEATYSYIYHGTPLDDVLDKIRAEIEASKWTDRHTWIERNALADGLDKALEIIDKYRTGSNEAQTNEIVYDIGGHMYGAMGGDVIMDILAGKGKK